VPEGSPGFVRRREDFTCAHCGREVTGTGYTNHCPRCLWSRHVDVAPGDRLATCQGMMAPVAALHERGRYVVVQRCESCGHTWRNRAAAGDSRETLLGLMGRVVPAPPEPRRPRRGRSG
jgi:hypothetical protein